MAICALSYLISFERPSHPRSGPRRASTFFRPQLRVLSRLTRWPARVRTADRRRPSPMMLNRWGITSTRRREVPALPSQHFSSRRSPHVCRTHGLLQRATRHALTCEFALRIARLALPPDFFLPSKRNPAKKWRIGQLPSVVAGVWSQKAINACSSARGAIRRNRGFADDAGKRSSTRQRACVVAGEQLVLCGGAASSLGADSAAEPALRGIVERCRV